MQEPKKRKYRIWNSPPNLRITYRLMQSVLRRNNQLPEAEAPIENSMHTRGFSFCTCVSDVQVRLCRDLGGFWGMMGRLWGDLGLTFRYGSDWCINHPVPVVSVVRLIYVACILSMKRYWACNSGTDLRLLLHKVGKIRMYGPHHFTNPKSELMIVTVLCFCCEVFRLRCRKILWVLGAHY